MSEKNPYFGATFAERRAARLADQAPAEVEPKAVTTDESGVEDKAVRSSATKTRAKKKS